MPYKVNVVCCSGLQFLSLSPGLTYPVRLTLHGPSCRSYATAHETDSNDFSWPTTASFTPYDILKLSRGSPYSKNRFYELVKIYHPDTPCNGHPLCKGISPEVRLQRYRLVVTANEILSDPVKRAAYDQFGAGWTVHSGNLGPATSWHPGMRTRGPLYANATWEDWERWYNRDEASQTRIVDHKTFMSFVVLLALLGGTINATIFSKQSATYGQRLQEASDESNRFLSGRRENTAGQMKSIEARVQHFLIRRDPTGSGLKEDEQPVYDKVLHPRAPVTYIAGKDTVIREE